MASDPVWRIGPTWRGQRSGLAYFCRHRTEEQADIAKELTLNAAPSFAANFARFESVSSTEE